MTRNRFLLAGVAAALGASALGLAYSPAQARISLGENRVARAEALAAQLADFTEAAKTCDLDTTREAYEALESVWNSVEIDVQFSSVERYNFFEHVYLEDRVARGTGLEGDPVESCENMIAFAQAQEVTWREVIEFFKNSPENSPAFNDVATLRTINQSIRLARTAIDGYPEAVPQSPMTAPDAAGAEEHWDVFLAEYPVARALIAFRNADLAEEIDGLVATTTAAFESGSGISEALAALSGRYNLGATLYTAAGRGHVAVRPEFNADDPYTEGTVGDILTALEGMRDAVEAGTAEGAAAAQTLYQDHVRLSLSFKTGGPLTHADVALTNAVNNYVAAQTDATTKALEDQIDVAEQLFVGQYWGTPALVQFLSSL
ncbi:MAG TPA: hypothetical protein VG034_23460 [Acidimicrobiia bacterium]|nr:hypothetical protein [Acidimicrobiia bacterium]